LRLSSTARHVLAATPNDVHRSAAPPRRAGDHSHDYRLEHGLILRRLWRTTEACPYRRLGKTRLDREDLRTTVFSRVSMARSQPQRGDVRDDADCTRNTTGATCAEESQTHSSPAPELAFSFPTAMAPVASLQIGGGNFRIPNTHELHPATAPNDQDMARIDGGRGVVGLHLYARDRRTPGRSPCADSADSVAAASPIQG
jgi:hypothetical protein